MQTIDININFRVSVSEESESLVNFFSQLPSATKGEKMFEILQKILDRKDVNGYVTDLNIATLGEKGLSSCV